MAYGLWFRVYGLWLMLLALCIIFYALTHFIIEPNAYTFANVCSRTVFIYGELLNRHTYGFWLMANGSWLLASGLYLIPYTLCLMPHTLRLMPYTLYLNILDKVGHAIIEIVILLAYVLWLMA